MNNREGGCVFLVFLVLCYIAWAFLTALCHHFETLDQKEKGERLKSLEDRIEILGERPRGECVETLVNENKHRNNTLVYPETN